MARLVLHRYGGIAQIIFTKIGTMAGNGDIGDLRFLTSLVAAGSLSGAARRLASSPAAMSRRLAAFEARLGVRLVTRSTRKFELTAEGTLLHERALKIIRDIDEAEAEASAGNLVPRGPLRIGVPLEIGRRCFAPLIADFVDLYPKVNAHLVLSDAPMSVSEDGLDVALYIGQPTDQSVITTRIMSSALVICAAPSYLAGAAPLERPSDVLAHNCIRFKRGERMLDSWSFIEDGKPVEIKVDGNLSATSAEVVHDWVLAGKGLALKPIWDIAGDIASGRLVVCLADYRDIQLTLNAIFLRRQHLPPRVRLFIDFIKSRLR